MANGTSWRAAMEKADVDLVLEGAKAFGLKEKEIFTAAVRGGVVTIVTVGGHKCEWQRGAKVEPLNNLHAGRPLERDDCTHCGDRHPTAQHGRQK